MWACICADIHEKLLSVNVSNWKAIIFQGTLRSFTIKTCDCPEILLENCCKVLDGSLESKRGRQYQNTAGCRVKHTTKRFYRAKKNKQFGV